MTDIISIFDKGAEENLYFGMIDRAAEASASRIISNGKAQHAVYLIYKFLETAERDLRIYSGKLAEHLNGVWAFADKTICNAAVEFLRRDGRNTLNILVEERVEPSHPFLAALADAGLLQQVKLAQVDDKLAPDFHFLLRDDAAFRVEIDKSKAEALVNFNDRRFGGKLRELFDRMVESAHPLAMA